MDVSAQTSSFVEGGVPFVSTLDVFPFILPELPVQSALPDPQQIGRFPPIPARVTQRRLNRHPLDLRHGHPRGDRHRVRARRDARRLDPYLQYAIAAATLAVQDASLDTGALDAGAAYLFSADGAFGFFSVCCMTPAASGRWLTPKMTVMDSGSAIEKPMKEPKVTM